MQKNRSVPDVQRKRSQWIETISRIKQFIVRIMWTINYEFCALLGICSFIVFKYILMASLIILRTCFGNTLLIIFWNNILEFRTTKAAKSRSVDYLFSTFVTESFHFSPIQLLKRFTIHFVFLPSGINPELFPDQPFHLYKTFIIIPGNTVKLNFFLRK